jgi:ABC-2 type transport system ATP-binding protein
MVALDDVTLTGSFGTIFGLIGRNGAGKTTAIRILAGVTGPDAGTVTVHGENPISHRKSVMARVGFLLDDLALFAYLSVRETLLWMADVHGQTATVAEARTEELLRFFDLVETSERLAEDLSTGMRKRLALAAAMIHGPSVLVLDEPFESLDPLMVWRLKELLRRFASSGGAVLLSSHLLDVVQELCDEIAVLEQGQVRSQGPINDVLRTVADRLPRNALEELYVSVVRSGEESRLEWLMPHVSSTPQFSESASISTK